MHFSMIVFLSPKVRNSYSAEYLLVSLFRKCSIELVYDCYLGWRVVKCAVFWGGFFCCFFFFFQKDWESPWQITCLPAF